MFSRRSYDQQNEDSARVRCFSFSKKKLTDSEAAEFKSGTNLPSELFSAPSSSSLSVASCSLSCVPVVPEVTPLHLDIPYVAASPASHSCTLASIARFDTPRASHCGPVSEAGRAVVAARKHSMRQEHLAAIANLNTFAKKRASKSSSCSESSSASRLSSPPISVDGQAQRPRNAAAAAEQSTAAFGGTLDVNPEVDWCDKPLLACGPTAAAADSHIDSGSTSGAGEWRQAGPSASQQGHPAVDAARPDRFEHSSTASAKAVALPHLGTDQGWMQASSLHPTPPLAQDMGDSSVTPSVQPSTDIGQSRTSLAGASLTSKASTSSRSSQQDGSTVLHTASMSSGSFYTHADSTVSKACSSPHHNGASTGLDQHRSCLQAPQRDAGAATSKGRGVHPTSEQQGDTTSQTALLACQGGLHSQDTDADRAQPCGQGFPAQQRNPEPQASLASRESSPDESLIAEGWIVAGTIMSNRDCKPDVPDVSGSTPDAPAILPQKVACSQDESGTVATLSADEVAQLTQELEVLKEQPRAQMTSQQLGRYLDIKIKLGRAGSLSSTSTGRVQQPKQVTPAAQAEVKAPSRPSPAPSSASKARSTIKPVSKDAAVPNKQGAKPVGRPAPRPKRIGENSQGDNASSVRHVPAYMKATASVKAKDVRDQQAKFAASRTALAEKKWNRA